MQIVKLIKDYANSPLQAQLGGYLAQTFDSAICFENIKNKQFLIQYLKPVNNFIIHTTAMPCTEARRMF